MGQVLYRKYRSRSLDEIVGQEHITTTLSNALKAKKISHAYLFTGPRGTGKTSIARILAHQINDLPYSEDQHFDIIEIDAASNNGVEDVRELRDKVQSAPTSAKYKVYIIDEVHMLSKQAFNALLKTLEEPPEHVVFILATTEAHKLPETIISRTQRYSFRPVPLEKVIDHLKSIAKSEKIAVEDEALSLIAEHGEGSFRDSISLLDQASNAGGTITAARVEEILGRAPNTLINELLARLAAHDTAGLTTTIRELYDKGYEPAMISIQLGKRLRAELVTKASAFSAYEVMALLHKLLAVPSSYNPGQLLELTLYEYALVPNPASTISAPANEPEHAVQAEPATPKPSPKVIEPVQAPTATEESQDDEPVVSTKPEAQLAAEPVQTEAEQPAITFQESSLHVQDIAELWQEVLQTIKQTHNTLYGIARMAKPTLHENTLTLTTKFPFHQKRLNETKNKDIIAGCVSSIRGTKTVLVCTLSDRGTGDSEVKDTAKPDVTVISNIFGGAELLD